MKLSSNNTIGMLIFAALAGAVFVLMAMRPAMDGNAMNLGVPLSTTTAEDTSMPSDEGAATLATPTTEQPSSIEPSATTEPSAVEPSTTEAATTEEAPTDSSDTSNTETESTTTN